LKGRISYIIISLAAFLLFNRGLTAQSAPIDVSKFREQVKEMKVADGDTLVIASLDPVSISSFRHFESDEDYKKYQKYKYYASKVYPYAAEAIRIFRETEYVTQHMNKRQRRKHIKRLQKELKDEFKQPLKDLTRTQGMILVTMIEKELETPLYDLIKDLRNGITAGYYNGVGKLFGYSLKEGYIEGMDPILDAVLDDLDISYEVTEMPCE
jgi:DNA-binding protein Fis